MEIQRAEIVVRIHSADFTGRHAVGHEDIVIDIVMSCDAAHLDGEMVSVHECTVTDGHLALNLAAEKRLSDRGTSDFRNRWILSLDEETACLATLRRTRARIVRCIAAITVVLALVECYTVNEDSSIALASHIDLKAGMAAACAYLSCSRTYGANVFYRISLAEIALPAAHEREILLHFDVTLVEFAEIIAFGNVNGRSLFGKVNCLLEVLHRRLRRGGVIAV